MGHFKANGGLFNPTMAVFYIFIILILVKMSPGQTMNTTKKPGICSLAPCLVTPATATRSAIFKKLDRVAAATTKFPRQVEASNSAELTVTASETGSGLLQSHYQGCGESKGCFGSPSGCISRENCIMFVTFQLEVAFPGVELNFVHKIKKPDFNNPYFALGISGDSKMNDDHVIACIKRGAVVDVEEYYNDVNSKNGGINFAVSRKDTIMNNRSGLYFEGLVICSLTLAPSYNVTLPHLNISKSYDLMNDKFFLLLAIGEAGSLNETLLVHQKKLVGGTAIKFSDAVIVTEKSSVLIQLHGTMMILAWLLFAPFGMLVGRYGKQKPGEQNTVAIYFHAHRFCMTSTAILTIASFSVIFVENKGYFTSQTGTAEIFHPIFGIILVVLVFVQIFVAMCRPHSHSDGRTQVIYNWVRWAIGPSAHVIGIVNIYLANHLTKAKLQGKIQYWLILTGFICFHYFLHLVLTKFQQLPPDKQMTLNGKVRKLKSLSFRAKIFAVDFLGAVGAAITLCYFVINALQH